MSEENPTLDKVETPQAKPRSQELSDMTFATAQEAKAFLEQNGFGRRKISLRDNGADGVTVSLKRPNLHLTTNGRIEVEGESRTIVRLTAFAVREVLNSEKQKK